MLSRVEGKEAFFGRGKSGMYARDDTSSLLLWEHGFCELGVLSAYSLWGFSLDGFSGFWAFFWGFLFRNSICLLRAKVLVVDGWVGG